MGVPDFDALVTATSATACEDLGCLVNRSRFLLPNRLQYCCSLQIVCVLNKG